MLFGIARRKRSRGPMETLPRTMVTAAAGVLGGFRGAVHPGKARRQISLMEIESWQTALGELDQNGFSGAGASPVADLFENSLLPWYARRANLLTRGIRLPRRAGAIVAIGPTLRIAITMECDPCSRMDEVAPGLMRALTPDWRGGVLGTVLNDGEIALGDEIRIER